VGTYAFCVTTICPFDVLLYFLANRYRFDGVNFRWCDKKINEVILYEGAECKISVCTHDHTVEASHAKWDNFKSFFMYVSNDQKFLNSKKCVY